jgi:hypothetical protein
MLRHTPWAAFVLLLTACASEPGSSINGTDEDGGSIRPTPTADADESGDGQGDATSGEDSGDPADSGGNPDDGGGEADAGGPDDSDADTGESTDGEVRDAGDGNTGDGTDGSGDADGSGGSDAGAADAGDGADADPDGFGGVCGEDRATADNATLPVDLIWVIDGSPSMDDSIAIVEANLNTFTARIGASGLDYRVVIIGADREYCADARCFNEICVPPPLSAAPGCPDTNSSRFLHVREGVHSGDSIDLAIDNYADYQAFLRPGAIAHFVFVTDDNAGFGPGADEFMAFLESATAPGFPRVFVHSIVDTVVSSPGCGVFEPCSCGDEQGGEYMDISTRTGGLIQSICEPEWTPIFDALEERVIEGTALPCTFAIPEVDFRLAVDRVNVVLVDDAGARTPVPNVDSASDCGASPGWHYDNIAAPTAVELCPSACRGISGSVELEFGCSTVKL